MLRSHSDPSLAPATLRDLDYLERQVQQLREEMELRFGALPPVSTPIIYAEVER